MRIYTLLNLRRQSSDWSTNFANIYSKDQRWVAHSFRSTEVEVKVTVHLARTDYAVTRVVDNSCARHMRYILHHANGHFEWGSFCFLFWYAVFPDLSLTVIGSLYAKTGEDYRKNCTNWWTCIPCLWPCALFSGIVPPLAFPPFPRFRYGPFLFGKIAQLKSQMRTHNLYIIIFMFSLFIWLV
jgi:hypothetical protein